MKKSYIINRVALRRAFREAAINWASGRKAMPAGLVEAAEKAALQQVNIFAALPKAAKPKTKKAS